MTAVAVAIPSSNSNSLIILAPPTSIGIKDTNKLVVVTAPLPPSRATQQRGVVGTPTGSRSSKVVKLIHNPIRMKSLHHSGPKGPTNNKPIGSSSTSSVAMKNHAVLGACGGVLNGGKLKMRRCESPDVTEGIRVIRNSSKGGSDGSSSGGSSSCSEEEEEDDGGQSGGDSSSRSSTTSEEYPPQLDFMGSNDKSSKRRTDRYDSSESSDSGVATLSPSTSDSSTECSASPYSPCSYDLSSDGSSSSSSGGGEGVGPFSCSPPSALNVVETTPPTLLPQATPPASLLGHPIMTAVSAVLSSGGSKGSTTTSSPPVTNYISFQVPNKSNPTSNQTPRKLLNFKNSINPAKPNSPLKGTTAKALKQESIQVTGSKVTAPVNSDLANKNSGVKTNCDVIRPTQPQKLNPPPFSQLSNSTTGSIQSTTKGTSPSGSPGKGKGTIKNIFAVALNFQQQQQKNAKNPSQLSTTTINNNNSTTLNKNAPSNCVSNNSSPDLKLTNMKQPYVRVTNIKGVSSTTKNGTKSFILHGEGQKNKVIIVSLASSKGDEKKPQQPALQSDLLNTHQVIKVLAAKSLLPPLSCSNNVCKSTAVPPTEDKPTSPKKPRLTPTAVPSGLSPKKHQPPDSSTTPIKTESIKSEKLTTTNKTVVLSGTPSFPVKKAGAAPEDPSPHSLVIDKVRNRKRKLACCSESGGCGSEDDRKLQGRPFLLYESNNVLLNSSVSSSSSVTTVSVQKSCLSLSASSLSVPATFSTSGGDNPKQPETPSIETGCLWKSCCTSGQLGLNLLEHIQTVHVTGQMKSEGYVCLWEGCKVYSKKSSSLSWLERHVLSHSGNKPFKCIFPGCGLSFSAHGALQRHVNSHISTNWAAGGPHGNSSIANRKMDSSPLKASRRKKQRCRKQRLNIGQYVDYFDKRVMEVIKHRLANSVDFHTVNAHDCTFRGQVIARRTAPHHETQILVHWFPANIIPDEWVAERNFRETKLVPLTRIPREKLSLLFPTLLPPPKREKQSRKPQSSSAASSSSSAYGSASPLSSASPSPSTSSTDSDSLMEVVKSELFEAKLDDDEGIGNCDRRRRRRNVLSPLPFMHDDPFEEDDWAMDLLKDELFPLT